MKILVIDDSKEDRDLIITYIKRSSKKETIKIDESNCLSNALEKIKINMYDVIILDLVLPESDGIETVKKIQKELKDAGKIIPIIVLTGIEDYSVGRQAWSLGIKDFLIKDEIQTQDLSRALRFAAYDKNIRKKSVIL